MPTMVSLLSKLQRVALSKLQMLTRLRELAIQGASDTIGNTETEFLDKEFRCSER